MLPPKHCRHPATALGCVGGLSEAADVDRGNDVSLQQSKISSRLRHSTWPSSPQRAATFAHQRKLESDQGWDPPSSGWAGAASHPLQPQDNSRRVALKCLQFGVTNSLFLNPALQACPRGPRLLHLHGSETANQGVFQSLGHGFESAKAPAHFCLRVLHRHHVRAPGGQHRGWHPVLAARWWWQGWHRDRPRHLTVAWHPPRGTGGRAAAKSDCRDSELPKSSAPLNPGLFLESMVTLHSHECNF